MSEVGALFHNTPKHWEYKLPGFIILLIFRADGWGIQDVTGSAKSLIRAGEVCWLQGVGLEERGAT